jgi:hypothetical protein
MITNVVKYVSTKNNRAHYEELLSARQSAVMLELK